MCRHRVASEGHKERRFDGSRRLARSTSIRVPLMPDILDVASRRVYVARYNAANITHVVRRAARGYVVRLAVARLVNNRRPSRPCAHTCARRTVSARTAWRSKIARTEERYMARRGKSSSTEVVNEAIHRRESDDHHYASTSPIRITVAHRRKRTQTQVECTDTCTNRLRPSRETAQ